MITGFNTDIEHDGVVYHVQTEDKGLETPIILSLVYSRGEILASKRSRYEDLIAQGFSDEVLSERLKRQHRLICAAIHSGRINDLKKMSGPRVEVEEIVPPPAILPEITPESLAAEPIESEAIEFEAIEVESIETEAIEAEGEIAEPEITEFLPEPIIVSEPEPPPASDEFVFEIEPTPTQTWLPPEEVVAPEVELEPEVAEGEAEPSIDSPDYIDPYAVYDPRHQSDVSEVVTEGGLVISLLDDDEFHSGEKRTLRVLVSNRRGDNDKPLANASVSIKILGTTFRPLLFTVKTEKDGVATVNAEIPEFTSGRAAVLVRAVARDQAAELRRVIHPNR
ncbi:MAG TPA: hypothetical protein VFH91_01810 [Pyrinomonadaceae bacterium]|nr:hypothetical protein [Pyrinomonadaceae bacterium]